MSIINRKKIDIQRENQIELRNKCEPDARSTIGKWKNRNNVIAKH